MDEVLPLVKAYYAKPNNGAGGNLHVVLDDGNLENWCVEAARQHAVDDRDADGVTIADLLLRMTRTQRHTVYRRS